jgi:hypothetical protein
MSFTVPTGNYFSNLSPSFRTELASDFSSAGASFPGTDSFSVTGGANDLGQLTDFTWLEGNPFTGPGITADFYSSISPSGWTFITAPEDISWDISNNSQRIDIFGTNNPPVVAGSRGMRDLTLSNSLVEGFVRNVQVEGKVAALESLMDYSLNPSDGFVSVPVYQVWANKKSYGGPEAYYIIKDVKVKEAMRDLTGYATRAYVDISLMQVPKYQVNSGRDQASSTTAGARSTVLISQAEFRSQQTAADAAKNQVDGAKQSNVKNPENRSGAKAGGDSKPTDSGFKGGAAGFRTRGGTAVFDSLNVAPPPQTSPN